MTDRLLDRFLRAFAKAVSDAEPARLETAWHTQHERTAFYTEILSTVAGELKLKLEKELLVVDYALVDDESRVPLIFIESENLSETAFQEVRKLCCLAAPVKLLLSVGEWDESEGVWPHGGVRSRMLKQWRDEVTRHRQTGTLVGRIVVVVAEWRRDGLLHFYTAPLDEARPADDLLLARRVGPESATASAMFPGRR